MEAAGVDEPRPVPERPPFRGSLPISPGLSPVIPSPLHSGPLSPATSPRRAAYIPCLGGPAPSFPVWLAGLPLPYPLPALARSQPAPHIRAAAGRGGREGGRAADGSERVDLMLARNSGKTQPTGALPPPSNYSSAPRSRAPSPTVGPFLSLYIGGGYFISPGLPGI